MEVLLWTHVSSFDLLSGGTGVNQTLRCSGPFQLKIPLVNMQLWLVHVS